MYRLGCGATGIKNCAVNLEFFASSDMKSEGTE